MIISLLLSAAVAAHAAPPEVRITSPGEDIDVEGVVELRAEAYADAGLQGVQWSINGQAVAFRDEEPFSFDWDTAGLPPGPYQIVAEAIDLENQLGSDTRGVAIAYPPPSVAWLTPSPSTVVSGTVTLSALASSPVSIARVDFLVDGRRVGTSYAEPYAFAWDTTAVSTGPHTLDLRAVNGMGRSNYPMPIWTTVDHADPQVSILHPVDGQTYPAGALSLILEATDDLEVAFLQYQMDGSDLKTAVLQPCADRPLCKTSTLQLNSTHGTHTVAARAYDAAGHVSYASINYQAVDLTSPTVAITWPLAASTGPIRAVYGTAFDSFLSRIEVQIDTQPFQRVPNSPYGWSLVLPAPLDGRHRITARATDTSGNSQSTSIQAGFPGLVGSWRFDEIGGSSAVDSSGNGHPGLLSPNLRRQAGVAGQAVRRLENAYGSSFVAVSSAVFSTSGSSPISSFTVTFWARPDLIAAGSQPQGLVTKSLNGANGWGLAMTRSGEGQPGGVRVNLGAAVVYTPPVLSSITWTHVAMTFDGTMSMPTERVRVYVNGSIRALTGQYLWSIPAFVANEAYELRIGAFSDNNLASSFSGSLDEVRLFNRALSSAEVQGFYRELTPPATGQPTLKLTSPADGAVINAATALPLPICAMTYSSQTVKRLAFTVDQAATPTAILYNPPPTACYSWYTPADGSRLVTVQAFNDLGASAPRTLRLTVDRTMPVVAISTAGGTMAAGTAADFGTGVSKVEVSVDSGAFRLASGTATWRAELALAAGTHRLAARATDGAGNQTTSSLEFTVSDVTPPQVSFVRPFDGDWKRGDTAILVSAADDVGVAGVRFYLDGAAFGDEITTSTTGMYQSAMWSTYRFADGWHAIVAEARDAAGNVTRSAELRVFTDNSTASVSSATIVAVSTYSAKLSWTTAIPAYSYVRYGPTTSYGGFAGNSMVRTSSQSVTLYFSGQAGKTIYLQVVASDGQSGDMRYALTQPFTLASAQAPTVSLSLSGGVAGLQAGSAVIEASDDVAVSRVELWVDGSLSAARLFAQASPRVTVSLPCGRLGPGAHRLEARAYDEAGNAAASAPIETRVKNEAALVAVNSLGAAPPDHEPRALLAGGHAGSAQSLVFADQVQEASIMTVQGRALFHKINAGGGIRISLQEAGGGALLPSGLYVVRMRDGAGAYQSKTLIVAK